MGDPEQLGRRSLAPEILHLRLVANGVLRLREADRAVRTLARQSRQLSPLLKGALCLTGECLVHAIARHLKRDTQTGENRMRLVIIDNEGNLHTVTDDLDAYNLDIPLASTDLINEVREVLADIPRPWEKR
jgi:hypothetical protein